MFCNIVLQYEGKCYTYKILVVTLQSNLRTILKSDSKTAKKTLKAILEERDVSSNGCRINRANLKPQSQNCVLRRYYH